MFHAQKMAPRVKNFFLCVNNGVLKSQVFTNVCANAFTHTSIAMYVSRSCVNACVQMLADSARFRPPAQAAVAAGQDLRNGTVQTRVAAAYVAGGDATATGAGLAAAAGEAAQATRAVAWIQAQSVCLCGLLRVCVLAIAHAVFCCVCV